MDNNNSTKSRTSGISVRRKIGNAIKYVMLGVWAIIVLFPFYWMILTSIKSYSAYNAETTPQFVTLSPTLENYVKAFNSVPLPRYFLNTFIFAVVTTALMLGVSILAAYAFSRLEFRGKNLVFTLFLSLILPSVASVFYIYLLKENFEQIPDELYKAAKVDGTSDFKYLMKVVLPIAKPTVVTVTILKVIECWNSYMWPRLITDKQEYYLVSNGIQEIRESGFGRQNTPAMMAAVVVISVPLIILFLVFRKRIMEGVSRGGTKG